MKLIDADAFDTILENGEIEAKKQRKYVLASALNTVRGNLAKQSSVSPSNCSEIPNNWISCSERMPDEHEWIGTKKFGTTISDEVYVTFESPKGERFCKHLSFQNKKLSGYDQHTIDAFYKGSKPIAWMPLPEPYTERREE